MERNSKGQFVKGYKPFNIKSEEERSKSLEKWRENTKEWHRNNKERVNEYRRRKRQENIGFRIACNLRKRLSFLLSKSITSKTRQTMTLLGCNLEELKEHLSSKFQDGMSFENYGKWHLDHIIPCDSFDLTDTKNQEICFHYTNLQPLWAKDNRIKSNKL